MAEQKARRLIMVHRAMVLAVAGGLLDRALAAGGPWDAFEISVSGDELETLLGGDESALLLRRSEDRVLGLVLQPLNFASRDRPGQAGRQRFDFPRFNQ
jgi:hypothetical protein